MSQDNKTELQILLEIAETIPQKGELDSISEAMLFIIKNKIESGPYKVQASLVYDLYCEWKQYKKVDNKKSFLHDFGLVFQKIKYKGNIYYYLNAETLVIDDDVLKSYPRGIVRPRGNTNVKEDKEKKGSS
jgi:hypothetical protein